MYDMGLKDTVVTGSVTASDVYKLNVAPCHNSPVPVHVFWGLEFETKDIQNKPLRSTKSVSAVSWP